MEEFAVCLQVDPAPWCQDALVFLKKSRSRQAMLCAFVLDLRIGKVIQISSTSAPANARSINSIWHRRKATFLLPSLRLFLAPRQSRAPLMSTPIKFRSGYRSASASVYSPFPQPNSNVIGRASENIRSFQQPFRPNPLMSSSRVGSERCSKVLFSLNRRSFVRPIFRVPEARSSEIPARPHRCSNPESAFCRIHSDCSRGKRVGCPSHKWLY